MVVSKNFKLTTRNVCDITFQKKPYREDIIQREKRILFNKRRLKIFPTQFPNFTRKRMCFGDIKYVETSINQVPLIQQINLPSKNNILIVENFGRTDCCAINAEQYRLAQENGWAGIIVHGGVRNSGLLARISNSKMSVRGCFPHPHNWFKLESDELSEWEKNRLYDLNNYDFVIADDDAVILTTRKLLEKCGLLQQAD